MKKRILLLVFACTPLLSFCQDYVVNLKGDTLRGTVKIQSMDPIDLVQVIVNKKKTNLTAVTARTIFYNNETYKSIRNGQTQKFMKVIKSGFLSLYSFRIGNQTLYDGRMLVKKNGQSTELPNLAFKKIMSQFLDDCETVSEAIKDESLKQKDLFVIIEKYNACVGSTKKGNDGTLKPLAAYDIGKKLSEVSSLRNKVDSLEAFSAKKDVLAILGDIKEKLENQETIPSYLYGVLKTHLADQPALKDDLERLIAMLSE